ncbi:hypothetical protein BKA62DRAFT_709213 [Auriculariales sp. MPI-PUGE-AT-0066]|nr:hypothetical protein BKA62DRAFT_709213 [Auriculariales sp. MPI-PUGE-AT-0066]
MGSAISSLSAALSSTNAQDYDIVLTWHLLFRTLHRGTDTRLGLPPELILNIFRLAECTIPDYTLYAESNRPLVVRAHSAELQRVFWFASPPFDAVTLGRLHSVQLRTHSHHQGWIDDLSAGVWSWFELALERPTQENQEHFALVSDVHSQKALSWRSHTNPAEARNPTYLAGEVFGRDHPLWQHMRPGDRIVVFVCAQFSGWKNNALEGELNVWRFFEPLLY